MPTQSSCSNSKSMNSAQRYSKGIHWAAEMGGPFIVRSLRYWLTDASNQKCSSPRIPNGQCKLELRLGIITFNKNNKSEPLKTPRASTCQEIHMSEASRRRMASTFIHYLGHEARFSSVTTKGRVQQGPSVFTCHTF